MTSDRTTRAKRALEQSEEMLGEVSVLTGRTVPERLAALVTDLARDVIELEAELLRVRDRDTGIIDRLRRRLSRQRRELRRVNRKIEHQAVFLRLWPVEPGDRSASAWSHVQRRIHDLQREHAELWLIYEHEVGCNRWLESVLTAGREMYERACAERDAARRRAASFDSLRAVNDALRIDKAALERRLRDIEDRTGKVK